MLNWVAKQPDEASARRAVGLNKTYKEKVMTPNILEGMKKKFTCDKQTDFMWFDLGTHHVLTDEELSDLAPLLPTPFDAAPKDLHLPFEKMALVRQSNDGPDLCLVTTFNRKGNTLEMILRGANGDFVILTHDPDNTEQAVTLEISSFALETTKAAGLETNGEVLIQHWSAMAQDLYLACMRPSVLYKKPLSAYAPVPAANNEKRIRKGKRPLFEWKTVDINVNVVRDEDSKPTGRTHASPRLHSRRGHFRTYASGKRVWVRETMVGRIEFGYIHHSYNLKGEAHV